MKRTSLLASAVLLLMSISLALPSPQDAGAAIVVTGGSLGMQGQFGDLSLTSEERGFSLFSGNMFAGAGIFDPVFRSPLRPGDTISLRAEWSGKDLDGGFTIDGVTYAMGSPGFGFLCPVSPEACGNGWVDFYGGTVAPPLDGLTSTAVMAPFTFSGFIQYVTNTAPLEIAKDTLTGGGTATINLTRIDISPSLSVWNFSSASYDFQTPEPSTLLLLGSGLAGLGGLAWRRNRKG